MVHMNYVQIFIEKKVEYMNEDILDGWYEKL